MDMKRPLMPGFLKKAEQKLLINRPGLWSTRIHLVLYYGILFMAVLAVICFLDPMDIRRRSWAEVWVGYTSIISIIALVVWLIYLLRFNVFKKYGIIHPLYSLVTFIIFFITTASIVLYTYVQMGVESVRANVAFGGEEIVQDINAMNIKICQLENASLHDPWERDTLLVLPDSIAHLREMERSHYVVDEDLPDTVAIAVHSPYDILRQSEMELRYENYDSVVKINDTLFVFFDVPGFDFVHDYGADYHTTAKSLSAFQLYHQVVKPQPSINRQEVAKELRALTYKYIIPEDTLYDKINIYSDDSKFEVIQKKYRLENVNRSLSNVTEKKYRWTGRNLPTFIRIVYYIALGISLLVFIFRNSTIKTFFLSLLTAVLLTIFTTLFLAYSGFNESSLYMSVIVYTILFFFISLASWTTKKRNVIAGIATNIFVFLVPIFPLMCATWYYEMKSQYNYMEPDAPPYTVSNTYWLIAEWSGALLFFILLATYIHRVYRRWYSLPEE